MNDKDDEIVAKEKRSFELIKRDLDVSSEQRKLLLAAIEH